jgi:ABC-type transport system involved in multi-copper enzyme maturation permease subunit
MTKNFFRQTCGVTLLALRASFRARVVMCLVLLQVVCALTLPHVVKGDGTPGGNLEILITYTLGFCFAIQALATLWASCSLFAGEISSFRIQMTVVKPVSFISLWVGKWFALLILNGALLVLVYSLVYFQIRLAERSEGWEAGVVPASRHLSRPLLPTPEEEARQVFLLMEKKGELPEDLTRSQIMDTLEEEARERYDIINPGDEVQLNFDLVRPVRADDKLFVRLKFDTAYGTRRHVKGTCRLSVRGDPENSIEHRLESVTQNVITIPFDSGAFLKSAKGRAPQSFTFSFRFESKDDDASALLLRMRKDIVLLIPGGSFELNLVRSSFVQGSVLAVLGAFGLALSACFSFPVASFAATVVMALIMISTGVLPMVSREDEQQLGNLIGIKVLRATRYVTRHLSDYDPLLSVVRGERISRKVLLACTFWNMGLMPLMLAILACSALRRRELANA